MWFEKLTGFKEESPENVRNKIIIHNDNFVSQVNLKEFKFGKLEILTLNELRKQNILSNNNYNNKIQISEVIADVKELHCDIKNANALFQVASQFNLLEMINPYIKPEEGISRYENDYTQGPACAIACGAGTIYRNYFINVNGKIGQTENNQIDCLDLIGKELNNDDLNLWNMKNGYALLNEKGILTINKKISKMNENERENLKGNLKIGIQSNTEVTISETKHTVSQIFCSALPVAYSHLESYYYENFARIILEALYEATIYAGIQNLEKNKSNLVYLTLVGGGAFGNEEYWILESLQKVIKKFKNIPLDLKIVSFGKSNLNIQKYINSL